MGSDAFQVDGVGIGMNCRTLSWRQRIAGGVGSPPDWNWYQGPSKSLSSLSECVYVCTGTPSVSPTRIEAP